MAVITLDKKEIKKIIGKKDIDETLAMFGTCIEKIKETEIEVEIAPNRPDLLSKQGFLRAFSAYMDKLKIKDYKIKSSNYKIIVDKSVSKIRPYSMAAVVKGVKFTDEKIKEIMQWQEKIHSTIGRNRKKVALGYYILGKIKFPVKYTADEPKNINFIPLEMSEKMNALRILSAHPCGRDYGNLLEGLSKLPVYYDSNNEVLSLPPIINSNDSGKIIPGVTDIFIECSGTEQKILNKVIAMAVCDLIDQGGKAYSVSVIYGKKKETADLKPEKMPFSIDFINKILGLSLNEAQVKKLLEKMGIGFKKENRKPAALIPSYRTDIMHEVDIAEEIAIAYGYDKFIPEIPQISTIGEEDKISIFKRKISEILVGLGLLEISTYHLSTKENQFRKIGLKDEENLIEVTGAKTENNVLRISLLSQSIHILSENSDSSYPQKIFELGKVFYADKNFETGIGEKEQLCISLCSEKANFTEIKQVLDYLMRMIDREYEIKESKHFTFIDGRCGEIFVSGKSIGFIGEINPGILNSNKIKLPVASLEISINGII